MIRMPFTARPRRAPGRLLLAAACTVALTACHRGILKEHACNKPQPYESAASVPPLRLPPGIDAPDTHASLVIPPLNEPAPPPRSLREPCLDEPPPYSAHGFPAPPAPAGRSTKRVPAD